MKLLWLAIPLLIHFTSRLRRTAYVPIDASYVKAYPWLRVSYFDDGTVERVHNPFNPETYLTLERESPRGRVDWSQTFQVYEQDHAEQFGPWDDGSLWNIDYEQWVKTWIEAIATRKFATNKPLPPVCESFMVGNLALYRPLN